MSDALPSRTTDEWEAPADTILITSHEEAAGTVYQGILSTDQWGLRKLSIPKYDMNSNLIFRPAHMERLQNANINVLVSSKSGAGMADSAFDNLLEPVFQDFKIPYHVHKTSSKTSHKEFLKDLVLSNSKENIIVIFGGDTLLFDVLNSLPKNPHIVEGPQITLCPVPCGTGNALATSLGITTIPIGISKTLGVAKSASDLVRLPILRITISESGREQVIYAAVVCSWGLHASLVADSDEPEMRRQYGPQRFQVAAQRLLDPKPHVYHGAIEVDGIPANPKEHTYLLISHVSHLEPTFPIAPQQTPLLDTLSLIEIGPMTGEGLMGVMNAVYAGAKHMDIEGVLFQSGVRKVRFTVDEADGRFRRICIDGEVFAVENGACIEIEMADMGANISV